MKDIALVIPSLDPDPRLPSYCAALRGRTDAPILLVDDGSRAERRNVFDECVAAAPDVSFVRHKTNRGKGRALKTAFAELLRTSPDLAGCVTADSDGQHAPEDVVRCMELLKENPGALVLGCRTFDRADIPWRSRFGNGWMRTLFRVISGRRFDDTQTGLRGIPAGFMRELLDVPGERFEFESEMLLRLGHRPLVQFPIRTIYENRNAGSHFRPFADSAKILRILLRPASHAGRTATPR